MPRRNYQELSPYDLECLVRDLLSKEWGQRLESFAPGPDGGVDVRLLNTAAQERITVQCKHSPHKSFSDIKSALQSEAAKVRGRRDLGQYWLATSASLSPQAKDKIAEIFADQELVPERVLGCEDLDALLNAHPEVERANYKLYITSTAVLELLLHRDLFVHARDLLDGIEERRKFYVQGKALGDAQRILAEHKVLIVSGPPGVGKTTLAEMLALDLIDDGFTPYWISEDVREADTLWDPAAKQLFFYDDFLGQNALIEKMGKNEDSRLLALINRVRRSSGHRLILTTREYILTAAKQTYERLRDPLIDHSKIVIDLRTHSRANRAHILYNHIYFSDLGPDARAALRQKHIYSSIIDHPNYNPRLLKLIIDTAVREGANEAGEGFPGFALNSLSDPAALWEHIFCHQLKEAERDALVTLTTLPSAVEVTDLTKATLKFQSVVHGRRNPTAVQNALAVLDGLFISFLAPDTTARRFVSFINPGVHDFVLSQIGRDPDWYTNVTAAAIWPEQIDALWQFIGQPSDDGILTFEFYPPEIRAAFLANPDCLLNAALRLIDAEPCTHVRPWRSTEDRSPQEDTCARIAFIALKVSLTHYPARLDEVLHIAADTLVPIWQEMRGNFSHALQFCLTMQDGLSSVSVEGLKQVDRILESAITWFSQFLSEPQDYVALYDLLSVKHSEDHRRQLAEVKSLYIEHATERLIEIIETAEYPDLAHKEIDEIDTAAQEMAIVDEIEDLLFEAREVADALENLPDHRTDDSFPALRPAQERAVKGFEEELFSKLE